MKTNPLFLTLNRGALRGAVLKIRDVVGWFMFAHRRHVGIQEDACLFPGAGCENALADEHVEALRKQTERNGECINFHTEDGELFANVGDLGGFVASVDSGAAQEYYDEVYSAALESYVEKR